MDGHPASVNTASGPGHPWHVLENPLSGDSFVCPGETAAISRAVHLQRLATGWAACGQCRHRVTVPAMSASRQRDIQRTIDGRYRGPQRTRFGVRGIHGTQLDRRVISVLISIVGSHLRTSSVAAGVGATAAGATGSPIVFLGYDGRSISLDLLPAATTALLQSGCDVVNIGRATLASSLEAARSHDRNATVVFLTGAGGAIGTTGFDVFNVDGNSVSVPWARYGLALELLDDSAEGAATIQKTHFCRRSIDSQHVPVRHVRTSGISRGLNAEESYRRWLRGWYLRQKPLRKVMAVTDDVVADRLRASFMNDERGVTEWMVLPLRRRSLTDQNDPDVSALARRVVASGAAFGFLIDEDDRCLLVVNSHGRIISLSQLAEMINAQPDELPSHVTAHAISDENRIALIDVGRPSSGRAHEWIADGCAVTGLLLSVLPAKLSE